MTTTSSAFSPLAAQAATGVSSPLVGEGRAFLTAGGGVTDGRVAFPLPETNFGNVAFVPVAGFVPAAAATAGTGAAATAGAAGTVASAPVLAAIAGGVLLVAAGAWVVTPEQHRAALLKQTLAMARGMLQAAGLAPEQINGPLRQIERAFRQGKGAVDALVNQWRNGETASPPQAPARSPESRVQPTGGALGRRPARSAPQGPNGPQRPAASAPPLRSTAPPLSAADRRTLQGLHTQVEALQAQAGRVLAPEQLANGSPLKQLAQIENSAATLLRRPGAQAHRAELTALQTQARQAVAGAYRFMANKAVAGLLTTASAAGKQVRAQAAGAAPHAAQPYPARALQQLLTQARQLLTAAADAPLLSGLQQWLAQRQAAAPVLDTPGLGQSRQPAPAAPEPLGQRSTITHTGTARGAVTGDAAQALEQKAAQERAENVRRAADWVYSQQKSGATMAPADLAAQAARLFGVRADEVLSAVANRGNGPQGAQGGVRSSAGRGAGGGAHINGSTHAGEGDRRQLFEMAATNGVLRHENGSSYEVTEKLGLGTRVVVEDVSALLEQFVDPAIAQHGMPKLSHIKLADAIPIDDHVSAIPEKEKWHDDQKGPLVVTDSTGKTYVIAGWGDFVAAKLSGSKSVLAHHFHLNGQWKLPSGDLMLRDRNGASIVIRAQEPTGRDFYPYAQGLLTQALQDIDPRIDLNHLPESARHALIDLVGRLFEAVPTAVVAQARSTIRNNSWQKSLDIPDHLEAFAQQAITALAFDGTLSGERRGAGRELLLSTIFDGTPYSTWQPDSVSGGGSFSGFAEQLRTSKDPVVAQIRRAIVSCLMDFYRVRTADEVTQQGSRLEALLGQSGTSTGDDWVELPQLIIGGLLDFPSMPSGESMEQELKVIIDNFLDHRERRVNARFPAPE